MEDDSNRAGRVIAVMRRIAALLLLGLTPGVMVVQDVHPCT